MGARPLRDDYLIRPFGPLDPLLPGHDLLDDVRVGTRARRIARILIDRRRHVYGAEDRLQLRGRDSLENGFLVIGSLTRLSTSMAQLDLGVATDRPRPFAGRGLLVVVRQLPAGHSRDRVGEGEGGVPRAVRTDKSIHARPDGLGGLRKA